MTKSGIISWQEAKSKHELWQENNKNTIIQKHGFVKIAFVQGDRFEHMFVKVILEYDQKSFAGILSNDPILIEGLADGDFVTFLRKDIEQYIPPDRCEN